MGTPNLCFSGEKGKKKIFITNVLKETHKSNKRNSSEYPQQMFLQTYNQSIYMDTLFASGLVQCFRSGLVGGLECNGQVNTY